MAQINLTPEMKSTLYNALADLLCTLPRNPHVHGCNGHVDCDRCAILQSAMDIQISLNNGYIS